VLVHVAFTPAEAVRGSVAVVVDVLRATSTIAQALDSGYERVYCCAEIDEALALRARLGRGLLGGERIAIRVEGFDVGASPREFLEPREDIAILSTTNGTRAILSAAAQTEAVLLASLLNLEAVAREVFERGEDATIVCAGFQGGFALDDAYCAGRIVTLVGGEPTDAAIAAELVARAYPDAHTALLARTYGPPGLEEDVAFCARESVLETVPRLARLVDGAAEIVA
jgi:2-phosphosulfolactate phosphatase